jgi:hypothetical protein
MSLSFSVQLRMPQDVLVQTLDNEAVLLHLQSECYFGLDVVGYRIWSVVITSGSLQEAYDRLLTEYDVEPERLRADLGKLCEELLQQRLLEAHGAAAAV